MQISGKNLEIVQEALVLLVLELENLIATCPSAMDFEDDIINLEKELAACKRLLSKVSIRTGVENV